MDAPIGRDAELAAARRFLDRVPVGPAALAIEGVAGIGKTTLWRAAVGAARARGWRVLTATAVDTESDLPFVGLRDLSAAVPVAAGDVLPDVQRRALDRALLRSGTAEVDPDPHAVCAAALTVVRTLARDRPVLVAVDDPGWLDRPTLRLLRFVVRRLRHPDGPGGMGGDGGAAGGDRVGVLVAHRPGELPLDLAPLHPDRIEVGPLGADAVADVLTAHTGGLPSRLTAHVHRLAGGNPFYAVQIGRAAVRDGLRTSGPGRLPVPRDVLTAPAARLAALPQDTRTALAVAALLTTPTTTRLAAAGVTEADLEPALADGVLELGRVDGPAAGSAVGGADGVAGGEVVAFTHPLLRAAATAGLTATARRALHRRIAGSSADAGERAVHLAAATTGPDAEVAAALDVAAERAADQGAPDAAADLADRAVALTPPGDADARARRAIAAARYLYRADDAVAARDRLAPLVADLPPGALRAEALLWSGTAWSEDDTATALAHLRGALADVTDGGALDEISAAAHRQLAVVSVFTAELFHADAHAHQAVRVAEATGDPASIAESRATLAWTHFWYGRGLRLDLLEPALSTGLRTRFAPAHTSAGFVAGMLLSLTDDLGAARDRLQREYRTARDRGADRLACLARFTLVEVERRAGHWPLALQLAEDGLRIAEIAQDGLGRAVLTQARGHVRARMGDLDGARADVATTRELGAAVGSGMALRFAASLAGFVALSTGAHAEAAQHLEPLAGAVLAPDRGFEPGLVRFVPDLVEALVALGRLDDANALLTPYAEQAAALDRVTAVAAAARCRALVLAAAGDAPGAQAALADAVAAHDRLAAPFERARTLLVAGSVHRRARRRGAARVALGESLEILDGLGCPHWAARARAEQARLGGRAPSPTSLTASEERVVELVVAGRSNREVAAELFLTVATVEGVLWRIYRKVGVRSRTELAAARADGRI